VPSTSRDLNADFGKHVWRRYSLSGSFTLAGVWVYMKLTGVTSVYALFFDAVLYLVTRLTPDKSSLIKTCRNLDEHLARIFNRKVTFWSFVQVWIITGFPAAEHKLVKYVQFVNPSPLDVFFYNIRSTKLASRAR